jgi:uncharacterized protein involved in exopolysaccharide biosynthesis
MHNGFEELPEGQGRPEPDLRLSIARAVKRSWPWICALAVLGASAGLLVGVAQPNTFVSKAKLLLRVGAREQVTSESLVELDGERRAALPTMVDELQMLSDVAIFERVAHTIGPREILQPADPARDDGPPTSAPIRLLHRLQSICLSSIAPPHACDSEDCATCSRLAAKALIGDTLIVNEPGSNVILVSHTSTSPERARAVVQALAAAFIERHKEQFSIQSMVEMNRRKVDDAKQARDRAVSAFVEHVNQSNFEDVDPQVPALQTEITAIETELFGARVRSKAITRQRASLSGRLDDVPVEIEVPGPVVMIPNEEYETQLMLKRSLLGQRTSLPLEGRSIDETHRRERVIDAQLEKVDEKLKQLPKAVAQNVEMRENLGHSTLSTRVEDLDLEDQELAVKIDLLQERLTQKQTQVRDLRKGVLLEALSRKDLELARDAAESRYTQLLARFSVLEALGSIELHEDPNLRVLQAPTLDPEKVGPKRLSLLLKGLFAGLLAGMTLAFVRQKFDPTLSYPEAFERTSGVRVLGIVPDLPSLRRLSTRPLVGRS